MNTEWHNSRTAKVILCVLAGIAFSFYVLAVVVELNKLTSIEEISSKAFITSCFVLVTYMLSALASSFYEGPQQSIRIRGRQIRFAQPTIRFCIYVLLQISSISMILTIVLNGWRATWWGMDVVPAFEITFLISSFYTLIVGIAPFSTPYQRHTIW